MLPLSRPTLAFAGALLFGLVARAQSLLPPESVALDSLAAFRPVAANWRLAGGLGGDPRHDKFLTPLAGTDLLVCTPTKEAREHLFTTWEHGDLEVDLDFLLPPGGDSGLYLQGRYEVQLRDSWGVREPKFSDCGGIYQTWDATREKGHEGSGGAAPRANASRAPGLWQHLHVEFRAPRFGADGKKTDHARFTKVVLNGFLIHENVEIPGPTLGAAFADEKPLGPLMIQGNNLNGAVAVRAIRYKRFEAGATVLVENLAYRLYAGEPHRVGEYDATPPTREGALTTFAADAADQSGKFAFVVTGAFVVPRDGTYVFSADTPEPVRLLVDGQPALAPLEQGGLPGPLHLATGRHEFRLGLLHTNWRPAALQLTVEGPGLAPQLLTARRGRARDATKPQLLIEPGDRIRLQRSFVPFEPKKRLYAINVGTPAGVHYAYDFETGAILRVWRGRFLDTFEMWDGRGENQIAKPAGPALAFNAKPAVALLESSAHDWPDAPEALWSSEGYTLEADGQPVFLAQLASLAVRDRIAPDADGRGLTRTLNLSGKNTDWQTWVLLAESTAIVPQPGGHGYVVGDREYYIDLPADSAVRPLVRTRNGRQQLVVAVTASSLAKPIVYTLVW